MIKEINRRGTVPLGHIAHREEQNQFNLKNLAALIFLAAWRGSLNAMRTILYPFGASYSL